MAPWSRGELRVTCCRLGGGQAPFQPPSYCWAHKVFVPTSPFGSVACSPVGEMGCVHPGDTGAQGGEQPGPPAALGLAGLCFCPTSVWSRDRYGPCASEPHGGRSQGRKEGLPQRLRTFRLLGAGGRGVWVSLSGAASSQPSVCWGARTVGYPTCCLVGQSVQLTSLYRTKCLWVPSPANFK